MGSRERTELAGTTPGGEERIRRFSMEEEGAGAELAQIPGFTGGWELGASASPVERGFIQRKIQRRLQRRQQERVSSDGGKAKDKTELIDEAAKRGTSGAGDSLPYLSEIQRSCEAGPLSSARSLADALMSAPLLPGDMSGRGAATGGGSALDATRRDEFEQRLGVDLSGVRLHTDAAANEAAKALGARAFTRGGDIYFATGRGPDDGRLLAHELAHVAQQAAGRAAPLEGPSGSEAARSSLEAEADAFAAGRGAAVGGGADGARVPVSAAPEWDAAPLQLDAEGDLSAALRQRFAASDRKGIQRHRARLRAICEAAAPAEANALVSHLAENVPARARRDDDLAELFSSTLHVAVRRELLAILARRAAAPAERAAPASPAAEPPTATGAHSYVLEPDSDPQQINFHVPTVTDDSSYIERRFLATVYGIVDGHSVYYGGAAGEPQAISVPDAAIDFNAASVENVGGSQIFDNAEQALAAVSAAGGRGGGGERPRFAYYRLNGSVVPTLFCPATTPRVVAGWLEAHRRAGEAMGALAEGLERLVIFRIIDTAGSFVGRLVIRLSETAPLTALEAMRRLANSRAGRFILEEITATPAPNTNQQWGAPTRGGEHTGAPPADAPRRPPSWHATATTSGRSRAVPPRNSSEEAEMLQPAPTEEGDATPPPSRPPAQIQAGAGGGNSPATATPQQQEPAGQQAAGGGGVYRGLAPVRNMDRHPLWTPDCQVWGRPQTLQTETTILFVREAIASQRYSHIVINRSLGRAVGIANARTGTPDIVLISRSGNVHVVEIQSPNDSRAMYRGLLRRSLMFLSQRGISSSGGRVLRQDGITEHYWYDSSIPEVENRLVLITDN